MRLVYFYQYFGTPKGGWSTRVYEMCRRWVAAGHHVTVVTSLYDKSDFKKGRGLTSRHEVDGIDVITINLVQSNKHPLLYRMFTFFLFSVISIYYALRLRYDVVIASSGPITIGLPGLAGHFFKRKPLVFEVRDLWPEGAIALGLMTNRWMIRLAYWFEKQCYKASAFVVCCSAGMEASVKERFPKVKTLVIPNACDISLFRETPEKDISLPEDAIGKNLFLYTGSLGLMDNCVQILNAAAELKRRGDNDNYVVVVGEGAERLMLQEMATTQGLNNIHFTGLVPKTEVVQWLKKGCATFLVFKPLKVLDASSPNKMFDSFAAGIPIIQTTQGWIHKLVAEEKCGINVTPDNPMSMANAVLTLASNPELRQVFAQNAGRVAHELFNRDTLSEVFLENLESLVDV